MKAEGIIASFIALSLFVVYSSSLTVTVDINANRFPIDQNIYGVNQLTSGTSNIVEFSSRNFQYPINRIGGNAQTSYAYDINKQDSGLDWYFVFSTVATRTGYNTSLDQFVNETLRQMKGNAIVQIQMIGWTPKVTNPVKCWGSSIAKYGPQDGFESYATDAGNGKRNNVLLNRLQPPVVLDPNDCSRPIGPDYVKNQVRYLMNQYGSSQNGGVKYYQLDNEMGLWDSTHLDYHPAPVTYDEMWGLMVNYSRAIREVDPNVLILSPPAWGWCEYLYSARDGCNPGPDYSSHGNTNLLLWITKQAVEYYRVNNFKVFDYLDVHIYPQAGEYSENEDTNTQNNRLQTVRSLYEVGYHDPSWIGAPNQVNQAIQLLPRLKQVLADAGNPSWIKLAISEYNWGGDIPASGISMGIAQAEILAIFGRERLDLATRWIWPPVGSCVENGFKLFLSYDNAGSSVRGETVKCINDANSIYLTSYAIYNSTLNKLYIYVFNKDPAITSKTVTFTTAAGGNLGTVDVYSFDNAGSCALAKRASITSSGASFTATVTGYSANLFIVPLSSGGGAATPTSSISRTPSHSIVPASSLPPGASASNSGSRSLSGSTSRIPASSLPPGSSASSSMSSMMTSDSSSSSVDGSNNLGGSSGSSSFLKSWLNIL